MRLPLSPTNCLDVLFSFQDFQDFLLLTSALILMWSESTLHMMAILLNLLGFVLQSVVYLDTWFLCTWRELAFWCFWKQVISKCWLHTIGWWCCWVIPDPCWFFFYLFCQVLRDWCWSLKWFLWLIYLSFWLYQFLVHTHLGMLCLHGIWPFIICKCVSPSLLIVFSLKST